MDQIKSRYGRFYGLIPQTCWTLCSILHFNELIAFHGFYWRQSCWDAWICESAKPTFICVCWRLYIHLPATSLRCLLHTSTAVTESNLRISRSCSSACNSSAWLLQCQLALIKDAMKLHACSFEPVVTVLQISSGGGWSPSATENNHVNLCVCSSSCSFLFEPSLLQSPTHLLWSHLAWTLEIQVKREKRF